MKLRRTLNLISISVLALLPAAALTANAQSGSSASASTADKHFVTAALRGGMAEVELGKLAVEKGSSDDVKQFGQKMVTDHTQLGDEMKQVAQQVGATQPSALSASDQALEAKLKMLSGNAFDRAYIQAMVKDHETDLGDFNKVIAGGSSSVVTDAARGREGHPGTLGHDQENRSDQKRRLKLTASCPIAALCPIHRTVRGPRRQVFVAGVEFFRAMRGTFQKRFPLPPFRTCLYPSEPPAQPSEPCSPQTASLT